MESGMDTETWKSVDDLWRRASSSGPVNMQGDLATLAGALLALHAELKEVRALANQKR
jgi:hypothetical protein